MSNLENTKSPLPGHYSRTSPCYVKIKEKILLTDPKSTKKTYHISLDLSDSDLTFLPGDSLAVLPQNDPLLINRLLTFLSTSPSEIIQDPRSKTEISAQDYLLHKVNLSRISSSLLNYLLPKIEDLSFKEMLTRLLLPENKLALSEFLHGKDLIDILEKANKPSLQELLSFLAPLLPRFYSISSSQSVYPKEVHLLVALSSYLHGEELRFGVASHFLCNLGEENKTEIPLYVQPSIHFRLPEDDNQSIIMVGPGTGVAPYRAFLQERINKKAKGRHWLFFGERNKEHDFLYEDYWQSLTKTNQLRLDVAFSRDQEEKLYVQHKLLENAKEIWEWLNSGAYFYVCGDAHKMAKDVDHTLHQIIQEQGGLSETEAKTYFKALKTSRRYQTDVY